ncbi:MAG: glycosyltransferase family 2 protein [Candidatus Altimarinota bacterium]
MGKIKVTIGLVLFGGMKYLPYSLKSLLEQDYPNIEYLIVDQEEGKYSASESIKKEFPEWLEKINLQQGANLWHSGGMNKLISQMTGDIFISVSQDMLYPRNFVSKMVKFFEENPQFDFATPRLYRWDFENFKTTEFIDSLGIKIDKMQRAWEVGQGYAAEKWKFSGEAFEEIFGASAALLALRKSAIEKVKVNGQVFDENLHYKNDVDLAYRLQWAECRGALMNNLIVHHDRFMSNKAKKPFWVKRQSLLGDWIFIWKNYSWKYSILTHLKTWFYLSAKTTFLIITNPKLIGVIGELWRKKKLAKEWRGAILRQVSPREMEKKLK